MLVLDSGGVSLLTQRSQWTIALLRAFQEEALWPAVVPTPVLIEALHGDSAKDELTNRLLKTCDVEEDISQRLARRAAYLRTKAGTGSAVDALVVALAEPGGSVLTSDLEDLSALADHANDVRLLTG